MNLSPTAWQEVRLGDILTPIEELTPLEDLREYITITVKRRHGGLEPRERIFGHEIKTKKQYRLIPGAFIISRVQCWHQAYAVVPGDIPQNMIASQNYDQFAISSAVDRRYFWWFSHSPVFTETVRSSAFGVVIEKMVFNRDAWLNKKIPFPPLDEQRRIVARIDQVVAKVQLAKELRSDALKASQAFFASVISHELAVTSISGRLKDILTEDPRNGWSARCDGFEGGTPVLSLAAITGFEYRSTEFKRTSERTIENAHYWLKAGDLLITRSNTPDFVGHAAIYDGTPQPCIYPDLMMRLTVDTNKAETRFVHRWLMSTPVRDYIRKMAKGTSPTMKKISQGTVLNIPFPTNVSLTEQHQLVAQFNAVRAKLDCLRTFQSETSTDIQALVPSILSKAFRGEL